MYKRLISNFRKKESKAERSYFITYGDKKFRKSKGRLLTQAKMFGFDYFKAYGPDDMSRYFISHTKPFIRNPKGGGYWLWKPYF